MSEYKTIKEVLCSSDTGFSTLNYLFNNYEQLRKFMTHLSAILEKNNGQAVRSDLKDIGCIAASMLDDTNDLLNHLQHYY